MAQVRLQLTFQRMIDHVCCSICEYADCSSCGVLNSVGNPPFQWSSKVELCSKRQFFASA
jgi:hypothetical protein